MRPARPFFESHVAPESIWVWDPWSRTLNLSWGFIDQVKETVTHQRASDKKAASFWIYSWHFCVYYLQQFQAFKKLKTIIQVRYLIRFRETKLQSRFQLFSHLFISDHSNGWQKNIKHQSGGKHFENIDIWTLN